MVKPVLASRRSIGFIGEGVRPAVTSWWLSGGISASNCVAAYQPKGAASYAASKVNLANPGTYDATDGTAYPTWDATNGWKFSASSSQKLKTGIVPNDHWSLIIRFSNVVDNGLNQIVIGENNSTYGFAICVSRGSADNHYYVQGGTVITGTRLTNGVIGLVDHQGYLNGNKDGSATSAWSGTNTFELYIGSQNVNNNSNLYFNGYLQSAAVYNAAITSAQVSAITTAMNAL